LPHGLRFDAAAGVIAGRAEVTGSHRVAVDGEGPGAPWIETLDLVVGDDICLTPPLGWNSWNGFGTSVTEADVRRAADELIVRGLADRGWVHVNIDDGWQGGRDRGGRLQPNDKFRDLKALCDDLHAVGLRVGIYSSPGPTTCGGFAGSAGHEVEDAKSFAAWGFDYLKYDWCSAGPIDDDTPLETQVAPFARMRAALDRIDRDIVYHVCQYGFLKVWTWARDRVGANAWRTTGDIEDRWESIDRIGFGQADLAPFAGPGGWNDPDMLVLGRVGGGWYRPMHPTLLTRDEERTHLGLWVLLCAPLLFGCDLTVLDAATVELAANREVLDVHQDPLGRQAIRVKVDGGIETWRKEMSDGSSAIGIFNRADGPAAAAVEWRALGLSGPVVVRHVWEQRDLNAPVGFETTLPAHGSVLLRLRPGR
jgi:alpha-galactosidase